MGSFANSLHVRCNSADDVSTAIQEILLSSGFVATDEAPDEAATWGMPSDLRAQYVFNAENGWTGVLDSDLMGSTALAQELSDRLRTYSIVVMVNDSDSWYYQLFNGGELVDEFDSSGGLENEEYGADVASTFDASDLAKIQQDLQNQMRDLMKQMKSDMPAEIRDAQERIQQGVADQDDMRRYGEWEKEKATRFMSEVNSLMSEMMPSLGKPKLNEADLESHLNFLTPILTAETSPDRVKEVIGKQAVFAEEILEEFLGLLGIRPYFANLSYRYLNECSKDALAAEGMRLNSHLKFADS